MYNAAVLKMPSGYSVLTEMDMEYLEGGVQVKVNPLMLSKSYCLAIAPYYSSGFMNTFAVAKEIFAHTVLYYCSLPASVIANKLGIGISQVNYIKQHSNPVDIGGDSAARRAAFEAIWGLSYLVSIF